MVCEGFFFACSDTFNMQGAGTETSRELERGVNEELHSFPNLFHKSQRLRDIQGKLWCKKESTEVCRPESECERDTEEEAAFTI